MTFKPIINQYFHIYGQLYEMWDLHLYCQRHITGALVNIILVISVDNVIVIVTIFIVEAIIVEDRGREIVRSTLQISQGLCEL